MSTNIYVVVRARASVCDGDYTWWDDNPPNYGHGEGGGCARGRILEVEIEPQQGGSRLTLRYQNDSSDSYPGYNSDKKFDHLLQHLSLGARLQLFVEDPARQPEKILQVNVDLGNPNFLRVTHGICQLLQSGHENTVVYQYKEYRAGDGHVRNEGIDRYRLDPDGTQVLVPRSEEFPPD